ncbi:hypothetical protein MRBLWH7_000342 [Microbacterium sp. LWH7-1.2]
MSSTTHRRRWRVTHDDLFIGTCFVTVLAVYAGVAALVAHLTGVSPW